MHWNLARVDFSWSLAGCGLLALLLQVGPGSATAAAAPAPSPAAVSALSGDAPTGEDFVTQAQAAGTALSAAFNPYPAQLDPGPRPVDCRTLVVPAEPQVPFRGTAILLHGFGACPNQFTEMAAILAHKGIRSFAPLLPGQGRAPVPVPALHGKVDGVDFIDYYSAYLPSSRRDGEATYRRFVGEVNRFAASLEGAKVVVGFSVGGGLATLAYLDQPGLYQRALLLAPFYQAPSSYSGVDPRTQKAWSFLQRGLGRLGLYAANSLLPTLGDTVPAVLQLPISWGEGCYEQNVSEPGRMPRRGICDFRYEHLAPMIAIGQSTLAHLESLAPAAALPEVQFVFSDFDNAADTHAVRKAAAYQQRVAAPGQVQLCANPSSYGHSFFSRPDLWPKVPQPYWLNSFLQMATDFVAVGTPFQVDPQAASAEVAYDPASGEDSDHPLPRCSTYRVPYEQISAIRKTGATL